LERRLGEAVMIEDTGIFVVIVVIATIVIIKWRLMLAIIAAIIVALVITGLVQVLSVLSGSGA
jgi:hypothetical protein